MVEDGTPYQLQLLETLSGKGLKRGELEPQAEDMMQTLAEFETQLAELIGRPSDQRPFVCEGSPLDCSVFIVGFNPATTMDADFWSFWRSGSGFDKKAWLEEYKRDRAQRPLKPGKTRRNLVSNTRRVIEWIIEAAAPCRCLETNIYALPSDDKASLAEESRKTAPFRFLLETIKPSVIVAHGDDAIRETQHLAGNVTVMPVKHFSRGWSEEAARSLGQKLGALC